MATNKQSRDMMALGAVLLAIAIVIFANLLTDRAFWRVDLTDEGRYSLSEPFMKILGKMESPAKLTYYVSESVPGSFAQQKRDILDKLIEIETASRGMIHLEVIDPDKDPRAKAELEEKKLKFILREFSRDKQSFSAVFSSMKVTYQQKASVLIPAIGNAEEIEYELASRLLELTMAQRPVVAICAPGPAQARNLNPAMQQMQGSGFEWILRSPQDRDKFNVQEIAFTEKGSIPEETKLLMLIAPKELSERAQYEILRYLSEGGRVFLIASGFHITYQAGFMAEKAPTGLEGFLENVGVRFGSKFVCDNFNVQLPALAAEFASGGGGVTYRPLPFYVKVDTSNVDQQEPITKFLPGLVMPFPGEMFVDEARAQQLGLDLKVLAKTSEESWTEAYSEVMDPLKIQPRRSGFEGQKPVFVKLSGNFPFPWKGKPVPPWDAEKAQAADETAREKPAAPSIAPPLKEKEGLLVIWACPDSFHIRYFMDQQVAAQFQGNEFVIPNVVEAASLGDDLIRIRSKRYETRSILYGSATKRNVIKMALIAGMPLLLLVFALVRWVLRRSAQHRYERAFAKTFGPSSFTP